MNAVQKVEAQLKAGSVIIEDTFSFRRHIAADHKNPDTWKTLRDDTWDKVRKQLPLERTHISMWKEIYSLKSA